MPIIRKNHDKRRNSPLIAPLICSLLLLVSSQCFAEQQARNTAFVELGGIGLFYSLNYERYLHSDWTIRAGVSGFGLWEKGTGDTMSWMIFPITAQYLVFDGNHRLELGTGVFLGPTWSDLNRVDNSNEFDLLWAVALTVGYRYQRPEGGLLIRVCFTQLYFPPLKRLLSSGFLPWGGLSIGYAF